MTGTGFTSGDIEQVIHDYVDYLKPGETYQSSVLIGHILDVDGVTDVQLNLNTNIVPVIDWMHIYWIRLNSVAVTIL